MGSEESKRKASKAAGWIGFLAFVVTFTAVDLLDPFEAECKMDGVRCERYGDGWLLEHEDFKGDVKLTVRSGEYVILRDVHVREATHVTLAVDCDCEIRGEDFSVEAVPQGANVWLAGDWRDPRPLDVALDGLSMTNVDRFGTDSAFRSVRLGNITLHCAPGGGGIDLGGDLPIASYVLHDVETEGCGGLSFGRREPGPPVPVHLERVHLNGTGLNDGGNDGITRTADANYDLTVIDSSVRNTRYAVNVDEGDSLAMRGSTIAANIDGISVGEGSTFVVIEDSVIEDNLYGIRVWGDSPLGITGSQFLRNGRLPFSGPGDCGGAISGSYTGFAHGSRFQGNSVALDGSLPFEFDATGNYWGAPTGPTAAGLSPFCLATSPLGDPVRAPANTVPFLTSPP